MGVVVGADTRRATLRAGAPVFQQRIPHQHATVSALQTRLASDAAFPYPQIVTDERLVRGAAEELARDEAVLLVHPGINLGVELDLCRDECMTIHVAADESRAV